MDDTGLLSSTLCAIREHGGVARVVPDGARRGALWLAGSQPLNDQAMQDLIAGGWLRRSDDGRTAQIEAWPSATVTEPPSAGQGAPC